MIKALNLYSGIGGNRKLWKDVDVTAVEINKNIAGIYKEYFPNDKVVVGDAHNYLLKHFSEYDFIWSSPPCQSHSQFRYRCGVLAWGDKPVYPDMRLYEEIIFLQFHHKGKWVVENVESYYKPLITPKRVDRHYLWSNFVISSFDVNSTRIRDVERTSNHYGFDLKGKKVGHRHDQILRNCVNPELGKHVFDCAFGLKQ